MKTQTRTVPKQKDLLEAFTYEPDTGWLIWKNPTATSVKPGDRAGSLNINSGYRFVSFKNKDYREHRLIWKMHEGFDPGECHIDHINGVRDDNRIVNLRPAMHGDNLAWASKNPGSVGKTPAGKYQAVFNIDRKAIYLGVFLTEEEARAAIRKRAMEVRPHFTQPIKESYESRMGYLE